jgi:DNA-binding IclR family transcriptional regulator
VPIDGSAASKVLLASRCPNEVRSLWSCGSVLTRHASLNELEVDLENVRLNGWAHDEADHTVHRNAVAAPVRDMDGDVAAALSLDLADRCAMGDVHLHARMAVAAASRISEAMRHCHALN